MNRLFAFACLLSAWIAGPALPCSICGGDFQNRLTLRQEMASAPIVVVGTLSNARIISDATGEAQTDLAIEHAIKGVRLLDGKMTLTLPRYYPGDGVGKPQGVFFFEHREGRLRLIAGRTVRTVQFAAYLKSAAVLIGAPPAGAITFFAKHLDHSDPDVATDAFLELARAPDADVARCARTLPAERLRALLTNSKTPPERLGLIAFLLACAGNPKDADLLQAMMQDLPEDRHSTRRGLLAGYIVLRPREGWALAHGILADAKRGFLQRYAVMGVLEFFYNWRAVEDRDRLLRGLKFAVAASDLVDMAAENLRRWQWWDLTNDVIASFDKPGFDSEIVRRAILRYALVCPLPEARKFAEKIKTRDLEFFTDVSRSLDDEK